MVAAHNDCILGRSGFVRCVVSHHGMFELEEKPYSLIEWFTSVRVETAFPAGSNERSSQAAELYVSATQPRSVEVGQCHGQLETWGIITRTGPKLTINLKPRLDLSFALRGHYTVTS